MRKFQVLVLLTVGGSLNSVQSSNHIAYKREAKNAKFAENLLAKKSKSQLAKHLKSVQKQRSSEWEDISEEDEDEWDDISDSEDSSEAGNIFEKQHTVIEKKDDPEEEEKKVIPADIPVNELKALVASQALEIQQLNVLLSKQMEEIPAKDISADIPAKKDMPKKEEEVIPDKKVIPGGIRNEHRVNELKTLVASQALEIKQEKVLISKRVAGMPEEGILVNEVNGVNDVNELEALVVSQALEIQSLKSVHSALVGGNGYLSTATSILYYGLLEGAGRVLSEVVSEVVDKAIETVLDTSLNGM
jgi:hypothetical protein